MAVLMPSRPLALHPRRPHELRDRVTRTEDVIVLCHFGVARLTRDDWSLAIDGLVRHPRRISFADLMRFPKTEIVSIHQCCGSPLQPDIPTRRICNVVWGGVRLSDVLDNCHPDPTAGFLWARGADAGPFEGRGWESYVKDLPLNRARDDVLIAYEMNGAPLRPENGYPVRLIVPGYYGTNSVKWLVQLVLAETRAIGPFTTRWYNDAVQDVSERQIGTRPVWSIAPESIIVSPAPDDALSVGALVEVWGWAWADSGVAGVDISADNGQSWMAAAVEPAAGHAWQRFSLAWRPDQHIACALWSRARTADGRSQPISGARNEIYPVPVKLTAKP